MTNLYGNPAWFLTTGGSRHPLRCFDSDGYEIFCIGLSAHCPAIRDTLRVIGSGRTRDEAKLNAKIRWNLAWESLRTKSLSKSPAN